MARDLAAITLSQCTVKRSLLVRIASQSFSCDSVQIKSVAWLTDGTEPRSYMTELVTNDVTKPLWSFPIS